MKALTGDTSNALHVTLLGMVDLIKTLLQHGHKYVLPGKIQSDRVEGEFGIYRQNSGGNYFISVDQVISSLSLERIKLFNKLDIAREENRRGNCCAMDKSTSVDDLFILDECFEDTSNLTCIEKSSLYYICGYITKKQLMQSSVESADAIPESEFTQLVSRGKLSHPPGDLYDLSQYFFAISKKKNRNVVIVCFCMHLNSFMSPLDTRSVTLNRLSDDLSIVSLRRLPKMLLIN